MRKPVVSSSLFFRRSPAPIRSLYQKAQRHNCNQEIVIGNNTALFATLASIDQHESDDPQNVTLFCPSFWLDEIHSSHLLHDWGQNMYGLPWYVRKIFLEAHPRYPEDKFITWQQYNEIRQEAVIPADRQLLVPEYYFTDWKAPETVAFGSLSENFSRIMNRTNNCSWAFEPIAYHLDTFPELVKKKMLEIDITLDSKFFNEFEATFVNHKAFQLGKTPLHKNSISNEKFICLFLKVYREVYKSEYSRDILEKDLNRIEFALKNFIDNRDKKRFSYDGAKVIISRSIHTLANLTNSSLSSDKNKKPQEIEMYSQNPNKGRTSKKIPTQALVEALNQCDKDSFIPIDKKQIQRALEEQQHSLIHDSFY